jgi:hypothetical protein
MNELMGTATLGGPLRIGLVSDTHIPEARSELWPEVFDAFQGLDLILHGGDLHELSVLHALADVAPVYAARGNGEDGSGGRPVTRTIPGCANRGYSNSTGCESASPTTCRCPSSLRT